MQPDSYLSELYQNTPPLVHYSIWITDGLEYLMIEISSAPTAQTQIDDDSRLIIVRHGPAGTLAVVENQPISLELNGVSFSPGKIEAIFRSATGIAHIKNPEALREEIYDLHLYPPLPPRS